MDAMIGASTPQRGTERLLSAAILFAVAGCATAEVAPKQQATGYGADAQKVIAAADWPRAETVTVALSEYSITPATLAFRPGKPYRLRIENKGTRRHNFTSGGFFKAIAVQKLRSGNKETVSPRLETVEVTPGEVKDLYFVAVTSGGYDVECSVFLHATFGMEGEIVVR